MAKIPTGTLLCLGALLTFYMLYQWRNAHPSEQLTVKFVNLGEFLPQGGLKQNRLFIARLKEYNSMVTFYRKQVLVARGNRSWNLTVVKSLKLVQETDDNFLSQMSQLDHVIVVKLPWSNETVNTTDAPNYDLSNYSEARPLNTSQAPSHNMSSYTAGRVHDTNETPNYLLTDYYQWVGAQPLCGWIRNGDVGSHAYHLMYNNTCYTDMSLSVNPQPLQPIALNWKPINKLYWPKPHGYYPLDFYLHYPEFVFYLSIFQDAVVTDVGHVINDDITVIPTTCASGHVTKLSKSLMMSTLHKEVFVINQFWGNGFFHRMIETLPRLAPYKQFLQDNPSVKTAVPRVDTMMKKVMGIFEINVDRLVVAPLRAEIVYLPQGTPCGNPLVQQTQILAQIYQNYTETHLKPGPRNKLVLIQRSGSRHLLNHAQLVKVLKEVAKNSGLEFAHWTDKPLLSFEDGMTMFHEAVMVVAPHGAGEANLIFSQPGTYVIELVCNRPHVNLCFQRETHILGHRYYAIPSSRGCEGFIDVSIDTIKSAVVNYIHMMKR